VRNRERKSESESERERAREINGERERERESLCTKRPIEETHLRICEVVLSRKDQRIQIRWNRETQKEIERVR